MPVVQIGIADLGASTDRPFEKLDFHRVDAKAVEVAGIEPASFGDEPGLLRAQPAALFSAPAVTQASC